MSAEQCSVCNGIVGIPESISGMKECNCNKEECQMTDDFPIVITDEAEADKVWDDAVHKGVGVSLGGKHIPHEKFFNPDNIADKMIDSGFMGVDLASGPDHSAVVEHKSHSKKCPECSYEMSLLAIELAKFTHCPRCSTVTLDNFKSEEPADAGDEALFAVYEKFFRSMA